MPLTSSEENYIKTIFQLQVKDGLVSTNEVATVLQTSAASVTDMLKKLKSKKLLVYEKYKGFKLNNDGKKIALMVLRKHRLWETFLVKVLKFNWDEVHEVAEQLEHIQSQQLIDHLNDFLGNPAFDPHGDPIPDATGKMPFQSQMNLNKFPLYMSGEVTAVGSQSADILSLLQHKKIAIGVRIKVKQNFAFDNSFEIQINDKELVHISAQLAEQIYVKKLQHAN
ncbi:metal-dependent transcriptional regulator [Sediminibacterium sp. TEGAF015]|uniref:metal-dependent transcriptional regulator n=1 Tax=Sediminibacterium sp. TEGAF015 TaxID=575378 RepID=UPI00220B4172|nr:metal-dependent transcriptional regulator [Sediminibacterium sp. TEGAF015]BDQ11383.1 iron-dependent repressor [Sediminibacterium sp. TEGAF015]